MSDSLDCELEQMQTARLAYFRRIAAKARRLERLNGIEPENVSKSLEQLIRYSLDLELDQMQKTRDAHFKRLATRERRLQPLRGIEPCNVLRSLEQIARERRTTDDSSSK